MGKNEGKGRTQGVNKMDIAPNSQEGKTGNLEKKADRPRDSASMQEVPIILKAFVSTVSS